MPKNPKKPDFWPKTPKNPKNRQKHVFLPKNAFFRVFRVFTDPHPYSGPHRKVLPFFPSSPTRLILSDGRGGGGVPPPFRGFPGFSGPGPGFWGFRTLSGPIFCKIGFEVVGSDLKNDRILGSQKGPFFYGFLRFFEPLYFYRTFLKKKSFFFMFLGPLFRGPNF